MANLVSSDIPISGNVLLNIPTPIINDILARLTPVEVGRCRCVCKPWLDLLSEAEFVDLHLSKSQTCLIVHNQSTSPNPDSASFSLVQVEDETNHHGVRYNARMDKEIPLSRPRYDMLSMIGSVSGVVCINEYAYQYDLIHIWNPIMGEFIQIPTPEPEKRKSPNDVTYGFGISSAGKYQVVKIFQKLEFTDTGHCRQVLDSTCHVYTLGTGLWKNIGHAPYLFCRCEHALFMNGNLHWMVYDDNQLDQICCLDLESECFRPITPPLVLPQSNLATLNAYKGCISMCDNSDYDIVIWVMKEYGVHDSWTKEVVINKHLIDLVGNNRYSVVRTIKVFEDGEILLLWGNYKLFSYHPKRKTVQDVDVQETMTGVSMYLYPSIEATDYVPSIVSLKNLGEPN